MTRRRKRRYRPRLRVRVKRVIGVAFMAAMVLNGIITIVLPLMAARGWI